MLDLETVTKNSTAKCLKIIEASPAALRECADRLEAAEHGDFHPGDTIICELTPKIHVLFKPEKPGLRILDIIHEQT